jgi:hypothetical protein
MKETVDMCSCLRGGPWTLVAQGNGWQRDSFESKFAVSLGETHHSVEAQPNPYIDKDRAINERYTQIRDIMRV